MKSVLATVTKFLFYVFCIVIFGWTASLTLDFVSTVLPNDTIQQYAALAVFDAGALIWLLVFLFKAQGLGQRAISLIMTIADLIGVGVMTIAALFLSGQQYTQVPASLGEIALWTIAISTFANVAMAYAFHITEPSASEEITRGVAADKVKAQALKYLETSLDEIGAQVGAELGETLKAEALRSLGVRDANRFAIPASFMPPKEHQEAQPMIYASDAENFSSRRQPPKEPGA